MVVALNQIRRILAAYPEGRVTAEEIVTIQSCLDKLNRMIRALLRSRW